MSFWPWNNPPQIPLSQITEMVQQYPELVANVDDVTAKLARQELELRNLPAGSTKEQFKLGVMDLRAKVVAARTALFALRDQWRNAVAEARRQGSLSAADYQRLQGAGLAGSGLGVLFVIGWPIAVAIAAVLVPATFVAAWSLTAESRAAAASLAAQNDAMLEEWKRRNSIGDSTPIPDMPTPPGVKKTGTAATVAAAAGSLGTLAVLGAIVYFVAKWRKK